jgi:hypothetical protein
MDFWVRGQLELNCKRGLINKATMEDLFPFEELPVQGSGQFPTSRLHDQVGP